MIRLIGLLGDYFLLVFCIKKPFIFLQAGVEYKINLKAVVTDLRSSLD